MADPADAGTLSLLLNRAEQERDSALMVLRQAEAQLQQADGQAQQLRDYRQDYDQRWTARFRESGTGALLHCHRGFGERLELAIAHQQGNLQHLQTRVERARQALLQREQRVAAVRKLIERRQAELLVTAYRREQRATDAQARSAAAGGVRTALAALRTTRSAAADGTSLAEHATAAAAHGAHKVQAPPAAPAMPAPAAGHSGSAPPAPAACSPRDDRHLAQAHGLAAAPPTHGTKD